MKVSELIKKLKDFPPETEVVIQFNNEGEWGGFDARSKARSVVKRFVGDDRVAVIRGFDKHLER